MRPIRVRLAFTIAAFGALLVGALLVAPLVGSSRMSLARALDGSVPFADNVDAQIFFIARLPRVLAAALVAGIGVAAYEYAVVWTPLQRDYLVTYVRSALIWPTKGEFDLLYLVDAKGSRLALDGELVTVTSATGDTTFALADDTIKAGATRLEWRREPVETTSSGAKLSKAPRRATKARSSSPAPIA